MRQRAVLRKVCRGGGCGGPGHDVGVARWGGVSGRDAEQSWVASLKVNSKHRVHQI